MTSDQQAAVQKILDMVASEGPKLGVTMHKEEAKGFAIHMGFEAARQQFKPAIDYFSRQSPAIQHAALGELMKKCEGEHSDEGLFTAVQLLETTAVERILNQLKPSILQLGKAHALNLEYDNPKIQFPVPTSKEIVAEEAFRSAVRKVLKEEPLFDNAVWRAIEVEAMLNPDEELRLGMKIAAELHKAQTNVPVVTR